MKVLKGMKEEFFQAALQSAVKAEEGAQSSLKTAVLHECQPKLLPFLDSYSSSLSAVPLYLISIVMLTARAEDYEIGESIGEGC